MAATNTDPRFTGPTPFARLAVVQAAGICGDACVTVSLAGSLFFTTPTDAARTKVLLYLALTLAPFAIIAPVVGPLLDRSRGGRRMMMFMSLFGRLILAFMLSRNLDSALLYPLAFGILVLGKTQSIAKSSLVPGLVGGESELVDANSKLALIAVVGAVAGGLPAAGLSKLFGNSEYALILGALVFLVGAILALQIPKPAREVRSETPEEREELHLPTVILAGSAFALLRGSVGFYTFFLAFQLKDSVFSLGMALVASGIGGFLGVIVAPFARKVMREEIILISALALPAVAAFASTQDPGQFWFAVTALFVAVGAAAGRVGFDSILQRDAPDAVRGRSFARFETRFQITWVVGGLLGLIPFTGEVGLVGLGGVLGFGAVSYLLGMRTARETVARRQARAHRARAAVRGQLRRWFNRGAPAPAPTSSDPPEAFPGS